MVPNCLVKANSSERQKHEESGEEEHIALHQLKAGLVGLPLDSSSVFGRGLLRINRYRGSLAQSSVYVDLILRHIHSRLQKTHDFCFQF